MKKLCLVIFCVLMLSACSAVETMETIGDEGVTPVMGEAGQVQLTLPDLEDAQVIDNGMGSRIYLFDGFCVTVQTLDGGNMDKTLEIVSGFDADKLSLLKTEQKDYTQICCAWSSAGEQEEQLCRVVVMDDGRYHYAVTVMADSSGVAAQPDLWEILDTVELSTD